MGAVLHIVGHANAARAHDVIAAQLAAGDTVTVAVLGAEPPSLPAGVTAHRVPTELSYDQLLDLVFSAEQVISW